MAGEAARPRIGAGSAVEIAGVAAVLAILAGSLVARHALIPYSDPATWWALGRSFAASFGEVPLAYLFPLYLSGAIAVAGPVHGFLANVPVLVALGAALHLFGRQHAQGSALAPVAGAATLAFWIAVARTPMAHLTSPYRDPLAYLLLVLAAAALVAFRHDPRHRARWIAASGALLALAVSAREPCALAGIAFLVYGLASRRAEPGLPLARPTAAFAAGFAVAIAPLLAQNALHTGNPFVPAQAVPTAEHPGDPVGALSLANLPETGPDALALLARHYGAPGLATLVLGLGVAVARRSGVALALSLPAFLAFLLLYGCYERAVPRYLWVLDLFAAPFVGLAAVFAGERLLRAFRTPSARRGAVLAVLLAAFASGALATFRPVERPTVSVRLEEARRLRRDLLAHVPAGARLLGTLFLGEMAFTFAGDRLGVDPTRDPLGGLDAALRETDEVLLLAAAGRVREAARARYGLDPVASFPPERYGMPARWERVHLDRVVGSRGAGGLPAPLRGE